MKAGLKTADLTQNRDHGVVGSRGPTMAQEHAVVRAVDPPRLKTTAVFLLKLSRRLLFFSVLWLPSLVHDHGTPPGARIMLILCLFELQMPFFHLQVL